MKTISRLVVSILTLLALLMGLIVGCTPPSQPISVQLSFSDPPEPNKPVKVTATFALARSYYETGAKNVTAQIILPAGFQRIDGALLWNGGLVWGTTQTLTATVKAVGTGTWKIEARAEYDVEGSHLVGSKTVYVTVSEQGATVSDRPPDGGNVGPAKPRQSPGPYARPRTGPPPTHAAPLPVPTIPLPIKVQLSFSDPPMLNRPVKLNATFELVRYLPEAQNVTAQIILPAGLQKMDGDLSWKGNLARGTTRTLSVTVKVVNTGTWQVVARADYGVDGSNAGGSNSIYITVSEHGATISDSPPGGKISNPSPRPVQPTNPQKSSPLQYPPDESEV